VHRYTLSLPHFFRDFQVEVELLVIGNLGFIKRQETSKIPEIIPAFARVAFLNPIEWMRLLTMIVFMIAPIGEPLATMVMARLLRFSK
jgi:hypothetical protein